MYIVNNDKDTFQEFTCENNTSTPNNPLRGHNNYTSKIEVGGVNNTQEITLFPCKGFINILF